MNIKSYETTLMLIPEYRALKSLLLYVPPILIVVGTFGNFFSFVILRRRAMVKVSSYQYLASLAVADSLVLYVGLLRMWLGEMTGNDFYDSSDWVCKLTISLSYTLSDLSVWLIIAVTVERYIVVCFPLRASTMINTRRAKKVILFLALLMISINLHFFWTVEIVERFVDGKNVSNCEAALEFEYLVIEVWPWVDAAIYSFVPFLVILVLNILIICEVVAARKVRQGMQHSATPTHTYLQHTRIRNGDQYHHHPGGGGGGGGGSSKGPSSSSSSSSTSCRRTCGEGTKLTIMLLTVSFTFLVTTLPMNVALIVTAFWQQSQNSVRHMAQLKLAKTIAELLMYVNHSCNFFLYCATGQKFRQQLSNLMHCRKEAPHGAWTSMQTEDGRLHTQASGKKPDHHLDHAADASSQRFLLANVVDKDEEMVLNGEVIPLRAL